MIEKGGERGERSEQREEWGCGENVGVVGGAYRTELRSIVSEMGSVFSSR